uniref:BPTI/Kunitz inhibitor domain-containing protein n=1 Tax=Labrus bergylta TaxID=56723 RepID=A0A3Q3ED29_9LABR
MDMFSLSLSLSLSLSRAVEVCVLAPETGLCRAFVERYFYNSTSKNCKIFIYGGCDGNQNNFVTESDCLHSCHTEGEDFHCPNHFYYNPLTEEPTLKPKLVRIEFLDHYFYNSTSMNCEIFTYGGCDGNQNNFVTESDCLHSCHTEGEDSIHHPAVLLALGLTVELVGVGLTEALLVRNTQTHRGVKGPDWWLACAGLGRHGQTAHSWGEHRGQQRTLHVNLRLFLIFSQQSHSFICLLENPKTKHTSNNSLHRSSFNTAARVPVCTSEVAEGSHPFSCSNFYWLNN